MQVQSVNIKSNIGFKAQQNIIDTASLFVNMDDDQLRYLAYHSDNSKKRDERAQKHFIKTLIAIPIADTIASGILVEKKVATNSGAFVAKRLLNEKAPLTQRLESAGRAGATWGGIILIASAYNKIKHAMVSKDSPLGQFEQNHPFLSFFGDIAAIGIGFGTALFGISKLKDKIIKKLPKTSNSLTEDITRAYNWLDNTQINKKVIPAFEEGIEKLADRTPFLAKTGEFALANSVWILFGIGLLRFFKHEKNESARFDKNYNALKDMQSQTAKHLVNELSVERDVLAQNQQKMAKELKKALRNQTSTQEDNIEEIKEHKNKKPAKSEKVGEEVNDLD